ncbi:SAM-dependent methyltransferase [Amycolatopsis antarctica]|uniref:SAM-dependent methyltransferase n=1 Tax=Amycolatopsis antarctica TaxID=1854586 RepID=A0A263D416_9PSEU|nr:methyltransferase domain-containing protein [Amycolatopsis antarctica]OZM72196.1 SAM-dependent methyltransferase [Amycolatopsis antarctica]
MSRENGPDNPILRRVYALAGVADAERVYDEWAGDYERDTVGGMGYAAPVVAAARLAELVPAGSSVLDAGCGTGLVGSELGRLGFGTIDGLDLSVEMLAEAAVKGVYRSLRKADLTGGVPAGHGPYEAVICVGTFTYGHFGPAVLDELLRPLVPGGVLVATVLDDAWQAMGFAGHVDALRASGAARHVEVRHGQPYHRTEDLTCALLVLEAA